MRKRTRAALTSDDRGDRRRNCWGEETQSKAKTRGGVANFGAAIVTSEEGAKRGGNSHQRTRRRGGTPTATRERGRSEPRSPLGERESAGDTKLGGRGSRRSSPVSSRAPSSAPSVRPRVVRQSDPEIRNFWGVTGQFVGVRAKGTPFHCWESRLTD